LNKEITSHSNQLHFGLDIISRVRQEDIAKQNILSQAKLAEAIAAEQKKMTEELEYQRKIQTAENESLRRAMEAKNEEDHMILVKIREMMELHNLAVSPSSSIFPDTNSVKDTSPADEVEKLSRNDPEFRKVLNETKIFLESMYEEQSTASASSATTMATTTTITTGPTSSKSNTMSTKSSESQDSALPINSPSSAAASSSSSKSKREMIQEVLESVKLNIELLRDKDNHLKWKVPASTSDGVDEDDTNNDNILGEGSFGIVYKGKSIYLFVKL